VLLELRLPGVELIFKLTELFSGFADEFVPTATVFNSVLPLEVKLVALLVKPLELFSRFVQFDLGSLGLCDFLLELFAFVADFDSQFFDLERKFFDFSLVSTSVFFESQIVLFFLSRSKCPLFQFFLVPVHFKFELVHALISLENHVLDVVQTVLLVSDALF
jgi:hypothetical protein